MAAIETRADAALLPADLAPGLAVLASSPPLWPVGMARWLAAIADVITGLQGLDLKGQEKAARDKAVQVLQKAKSYPNAALGALVDASQQLALAVPSAPIPAEMLLT